MRDSINEFLINNAIEEKGEVALYTGPMQCFCVMEKKLKHKKAEVYELKNDEGKVEDVEAQTRKVLVIEWPDQRTVFEKNKGEVFFCSQAY